MFKFLKELVDSVKEGWSEGKAELAQEEAAAELTRVDRLADLERLLAGQPSIESYLVASAAPYRVVFATGALEAEPRDFAPADLYRMALPAGKHDEWRKLLKRDFGSADGKSARATLHAMLEEPWHDPYELALLSVRCAHLGSVAAAVGYMEQAEVEDCLAPLLVLQAIRFDSWSAFGEAFLQGEKNAPGSNVLGRKVLAASMRDLLANQNSPWRRLPWLSLEEAEALIGRSSGVGGA